MALTTAPAVLLGRCNPYGAETGGPRRVMAGLHGPASAACDPDDLPGLPVHVQQGEWSCPQPAVVRVRMTCRCGHQGDIMPLCSWHEETVTGGEMVAGTFRRVTRVQRTMGHYEMISRRQSSACLRCMFPGQYAEFYKALFRHQQELAVLRDTGQWYSDRAGYKRQVIEDLVKQFDAGQQSAANPDGPIHKCPMTLIPVS